MVSPHYMLGKPLKPSRPKQWFDQEVVPTLISLAASTEAVLEHIATTAKRAPGPALCAAFCLGVLLDRVAAGRRPKARPLKTPTRPR